MPARKTKPKVKTGTKSRPTERRAPKKIDAQPNSKPDKPGKSEPKPINRKGQGYVSVKPEPGQARAVQKWINRVCGIQGGTTARGMHVTIIYDKRNYRYEVDRRRGALYAATVKAPALFGDTLVLLLDSPDLAARHQALVDAGHRHSYPQYRPHISIKEGADASDLERAVGCMSRLLRMLPKVTLYNETWRKIDDKSPRQARQPKSVPKAAVRGKDRGVDKDAAGMLSVDAESADGWDRVSGRNGKGVHQTCYVNGDMMIHKTNRYHYGNDERWRAGRMKAGSNPLDIEMDGDTSVHPTLGAAKAACLPENQKRMLP